MVCKRSQIFWQRCTTTIRTNLHDASFFIWRSTSLLFYFISSSLFFIIIDIIQIATRLAPKRIGLPLFSTTSFDRAAWKFNFFLTIHFNRSLRAIIITIISRCLIIESSKWFSMIHEFAWDVPIVSLRDRFIKLSLIFLRWLRLNFKLTR